MKIELSIDGGITWEMLTTRAFDNKFQMNMPEVNSDRCLIRIKQLEGSGSKIKKIVGHTFYVKDIDINSNKGLIASAGNDRLLKVRNYKTGQSVFQTNSTFIFQRVCFNHSGSMLATVMSDNSVQVYSTDTWTIIKPIPDTKGWASALAFSKGDSVLCTANGDNTLKIYNFNTNQENNVSTGQNNLVEILPIISPTKSGFYSFSSDGTIKEISITGDIIKTITISGGISSVITSPDNYKFAAVSSSGRNISFYDISSGTLLDEIKTTNTFTKIAWSSDGITLACGDNKGNIYFYDAETKALLNQNALHYNAVTDLLWDGTDILFSSGNDNYIYETLFNLSIQEAVSDNYWSIAPVLLSGKDIYFSSVPIGISADTIINPFIENDSKFNIIIDSIRITNDAGAEFQIVSGYGEKLMNANSSRDIEIAFSPKLSGQRSAKLIIYFGADKLTYNIFGTGINSEIKELTKYVNFGKISTDEKKDTLINIFTNISELELPITSIKIIGPDTLQFDYAEDYLQTIGKGDTFKLNLNFAPFKRGKASSAMLISFGEVIKYNLQINMLGEGYSNCGENSFNFTQFEDLALFKTAGIAALSTAEKAIVLTSASPQNSGAVWTKSFLPLDSGFTVEFSFSMSEPHQTDENEYSEPGADGLTFVIQNQSNTAIGTGGGGIAYEGIRNGIAVEYDLYSNDKNQIVDRFDPNGNHIALMIPTDSVLSAFHYKANTKVMNKDILTMKSDGRKYYSKLEYKPLERTFNVYLDSVNTFTQPVIFINDFHLSDYISLAYGKGAYLGFTASCGSSYQRHKIYSWKFCNSLSAQPIISSVEEEFLSSNYIFPNPASEYIEINQHSINSESEIRIFNTFGEVVFSDVPHLVDTAHIKRIDISHLPIGVYYIRIGNYTEKFVVVR